MVVSGVQQWLNYTHICTYICTHICIYVYMYTHMYVYMYMCVLRGVWLYAAPWTVACQAPLSMEFSRQVYWSQLPFPTLGALPDLGIEPMSCISCTGRQILYHQHHLGSGVHIYILFFRLFSRIDYYKHWVQLPILHSRSLLPTLYIVVNMCQSQTPSLPCTPPPFGTLAL